MKKGNKLSTPEWIIIKKIFEDNCVMLKKEFIGLIHNFDNNELKIILTQFVKKKNNKTSLTYVELEKRIEQMLRAPIEEFKTRLTLKLFEEFLNLSNSR